MSVSYKKLNLFTVAVRSYGEVGGPQNLVSIPLGLESPQKWDVECPGH